MEFWDLYNEKREIIGQHIRGNAIPENAYHLVVHVWIKNSKEQYLISQRSASRNTFPLMWETVGGSVLKGENSLDGAIREVKEEIGVELNANDGTLAFSEIRKSFNDIVDVWVFNFDGEIDLSNATTDEVAQTKWLERRDVIQMLNDGRMVNTLSYFKEKISPEIKWLFFDLGSTLIDESVCYENRINEIVKVNNLDLGEFTAKVIECAQENAFAIKAAAKYYDVTVPSWNCELERLYPCTTTLLGTLSQKYCLGIIANQEAGTTGRLEKWGIKQYFDVIIASTEAGCSKPDLKIFEIALNQAGCRPDNAVMIGDRLDNDIIPAKKLGMKTIWVKQGFTSYQSDSDIPDYTINSIDDIRSIL